MDGRVCAFRMQKGTLVAPSPHTVCDLHQPIVTIIPVAYLHKTGSNSQMGATQGRDEASGANWLVVVGVLGQVAFLSSVGDQPAIKEPNDGLFFPRPTHTPIGVENTSRFLTTLKELINNEGVMSGPITSACLVAGARLCYTVGSSVFIADLFDNFGSSGKLGSGVENSRSDSHSMPDNSPMKLPCQRIPVSNVVTITGPGPSTYNGTHSLVALTGAGRLLSIKTSMQFASPFSSGNLRVDCCQNTLKAHSGKYVKVSFSNLWVITLDLSKYIEFAVSTDLNFEIFKVGNIMILPIVSTK